VETKSTFIRTFGDKDTVFFIYLFIYLFTWKDLNTKVFGSPQLTSEDVKIEKIIIIGLACLSGGPFHGIYTNPHHMLMF
jgi:hypothetical protein